jgi:steroid delta-isomerase-like uncharacterized protein
VGVEENKEFMRRYFDEVWRAKDADAVDRYVHADVLLRNMFSEEAGEARGNERVKENVRMLAVAMPGFGIWIHDMVAEGDRVAVRFTADGRHEGDLNGLPATHRWSELHATTVARIEDGKIVEGWQVSDTLGMLHQLRVVPERPPRVLRWLLAARGRFSKRRAPAQAD